jgi:hypothetical protein
LLLFFRAPFMEMHTNRQLLAASVEQLVRRQSYCAGPSHLNAREDRVGWECSDEWLLNEKTVLNQDDGGVAWRYERRD